MLGGRGGPPPRGRLNRSAQGRGWGVPAGSTEGPTPGVAAGLGSPGAGGGRSPRPPREAAGRREAATRVGERPLSRPLRKGSQTNGRGAPAPVHASRLTVSVGGALRAALTRGVHSSTREPTHPTPHPPGPPLDPLTGPRLRLDTHPIHLPPPPTPPGHKGTLAETNWGMLDSALTNTPGQNPSIS